MLGGPHAQHLLRGAMALFPDHNHPHNLQHPHYPHSNFHVAPPFHAAPHVISPNHTGCLMHPHGPHNPSVNQTHVHGVVHNSVPGPIALARATSAHTEQLGPQLSQAKTPPTQKTTNDYTHLKKSILRWDWDTETAVMQPTGTTGLGVQRGTVTRCTDDNHGTSHEYAGCTFKGEAHAQQQKLLEMMKNTWAERPDGDVDPEPASKSSVRIPESAASSCVRASSGTAATPAKKAVVPDKAKIFKQITTVDKGIGDLLTIDVKPTGDKVVLSEQQAKIFKQITTVDKGIGGMLTLGWKPTDDKVVLSNPDQWTMPKASTQLRGQELIEAAIRGDAKMVVSMLSKDSTILNWHDPIRPGRTATYWAAALGKDKVLDVLLEHGTDIEQKTCDGWTPFMAACWGGHAACVVLLLKKGCCTSHKDKCGLTGRDLATQYWRQGASNCANCKHDYFNCNHNVWVEKPTGAQTRRRRGIGNGRTFFKVVHRCPLAICLGAWHETTPGSGSKGELCALCKVLNAIANTVAEVKQDCSESSDLQRANELKDIRGNDEMESSFFEWNASLIGNPNRMAWYYTKEKTLQTKLNAAGKRVAVWSGANVAFETRERTGHMCLGRHGEGSTGKPWEPSLTVTHHYRRDLNLK